METSTYGLLTGALVLAAATPSGFLAGLLLIGVLIEHIHLVVGGVALILIWKRYGGLT